MPRSNRRTWLVSVAAFVLTAGACGGTAAAPDTTGSTTTLAPSTTVAEETTTTAAVSAEVELTALSVVPHPRLDLIDRSRLNCEVTGERTLPDGTRIDIEECTGAYTVEDRDVHVRHGADRPPSDTVQATLDRGDYFELFIDGREQEPAGYLDTWDGGEPVAASYWVLESMTGTHELRGVWYAQGEAVITSTNTVRFGATAFGLPIVSVEDLPYSRLDLAGGDAEYAVCGPAFWWGWYPQPGEGECRAELVVFDRAVHIRAGWQRDATQTIEDVENAGYYAELRVDRVTVRPDGYVETREDGTPTAQRFWVLEDRSGPYEVEATWYEPGGVRRRMIVDVHFVPFPELEWWNEDGLECRSPGGVYTCFGQVSFPESDFSILGMVSEDRPAQVDAAGFVAQGYGTSLLIDGAEVPALGTVLMYLEYPEGGEPMWAPVLHPYWVFEGMTGTHEFILTVHDPAFVGGVMEETHLIVHFP